MGALPQFLNLKFLRHWKEISTSAATLCARLALVASMLIINGIAKRRMSDDQFGLWTILYSINLLTNVFDFGFRFTLGNRLAALGSRGEEAEAERRETFLGIMALQAAISVVLIVLACIVSPLLPWASWFKITDPHLAAEVHELMPMVLPLMFASLPVMLIWTVFFAYHEITLASFLAGIMIAVQTAVFIVAIYWFRFPWVMLSYFSSAIVLGFISTIYMFVRRKWRFSFLPISRIFSIVASMAGISFHFFLGSIAAVIANALGTIVSGATSGLAAAGDFTLVQKVFSLLVTAHLSTLAPLSPVVTLESHSGNWDSVRRRLRVRVLVLWPVVFLGCGAMLWWAHPYIIRVWAGKWLFQYKLAALMLAWACLTGFVNTFTVFLNSLGLVKMQATVAFVMILPNVFLPVILGRWFGPPGIALAMAICMIPLAIVWPLYTRRAFRLKLIRV